MDHGRSLSIGSVFVMTCYAISWIEKKKTEAKFGAYLLHVCLLLRLALVRPGDFWFGFILGIFQFCVDLFFFASFSWVIEVVSCLQCEFQYRYPANFLFAFDSGHHGLGVYNMIKSSVNFASLSHHLPLLLSFYYCMSSLSLSC